MQAHTHSLDQVFAPVGQIAVPLFQRNYVWEAEKHCLPLWEDIQRLADRYFVGDQSKPHFLGTIVLEQLPFPMGSVPIRQIIDGQQRLITLQILMAAARDLCLERGLENIAERFSSLTKNQLVGKQSTEEQFKVWPTNADRDHYRTIMESGSLATLKRSYRATGGSWIPNDRIPATYLSFYHWITDWIDQDKSKQEEKFSALYNVLQFRVSMVIIDLDPSDDAQVIFETLNARGTPLLPSDLIKNYLLRLSEKDGLAVKQVYEKYWMPIDQDRKFWEEKIAQGRYFRPRIDTFFQYYLTLRVNDEIQSSDLFNIFRDDVNRSGLSPEEHLASIAEYASIFRGWYRSLEGREKLFFYRLATLETTTVMPFLLELFRQVNNRDDRIPILADLESYLVRRAICRLTAKNYNRLFLELLQLCRKVGFQHSVVCHFLESQNGDISI